MPDNSTTSAENLMQQPNNGLSQVMRQSSVYSDKTKKPPKNLSDMPFDVVGLIIERSDYKQQLILRKTSKPLRSLVDEQKPSCARLRVSFKSDCFICDYNGHCVAYVSPNWNRAEFSSLYSKYRLDKIISKTNYKQVAFDDLAFTLKNPKLQLEYFSFDSECDSCCCADPNKYGIGKFRIIYKKMQEILESINHPLSVKACRIDLLSFSNAMPILPYLTPGVLEKITIFCKHFDAEWSENPEAIQQLVHLKQWTQAKELVLECGFDYDFPTEHYSHFKRFHSKEEYLCSADLGYFRDLISEHKNIEFCSISGEYENMGEFQSVVGTKVSPKTSHYSIPDSDDYLEFKFKKNLITIEKKKKQ